jgi:protein O-mannosyl-transferase
MPVINNSYKDSLINIRYHLLICFFLVVATATVYWQVKDHEFVNLDDDIYFDEHYVKEGITVDGIKWAFSLKDKESTYWHPLTWLSFMLSYELYGPNPGMHHSISLIIHIANSLLLFIVLRRMTGTLWRSAFVAVLFALHPINVESVAWVTQRPNILSTSFWMLTMLAYFYYTHRPGLFRYLLVLIIFMLGLMAKPMLISLPFVLLLLDYWPLKRISFPISRKVLISLILEKIPLLTISAVSVFITIKSIGAVVSTATVPVKLRIANALVSYVGYIWKMIWPHNLSVYYPYPFALPSWKFAGAGFLLVCFSVLIIWVIRKQSYLIVGWLWFIGTLVPLIGLVQTGLQPALADRYAYVSFIGLFIMVAWGIPELLRGWRGSKIGLGIFSIALLLILMMTTWLQLKYWEKSITLFEHAIKVTSNNAIAHNNFGTALAKDKRVNEAIGHFTTALKIFPNYKKACYNLGLAMLSDGNYEKAVYYFFKYLKLCPDDAKGYHRIGLAYFHQGEIAKSSENYFKALDIDSEFDDVHFGLGINFASQGDYENAIKHYHKVLHINADYIDAYINLGNIFFKNGQFNKAISLYTEALRINPNYVTAYLNLGATMLRKGNIQEAVLIFQKANKINPDDIIIQGTLKKALEILKRSKALNK